MDEKKSTKISLETAVCLFIIAILLVALGITYYFGFVKNKEKINKLENENNTLANTQQTLENQIKTLQKEKNSNKQSTNITEKFEEVEFYENAIKYISCTYDIQPKRLRIFNVGTGVNPTLFIITENGEVYEKSSSTGKFGLNEALKEYKVEDILSQTGETDNVFEILLKDGTKKEVIEDLGI